GIVEGALQPFREVALAPGQGGKPALALGPVTRRQIEERLGQAVALEPRRDLARREIIGKEILDAAEARFRRRTEAVEEGHVLEHHAEIGGELRHRRYLL